MTAALYRGSVSHHRFSPIRRSFRRRLFFAYLDVDTIDATLDRLPLWLGVPPRAPVHFRRRDFFDGTNRPLGDAVRDLVAQRLGRRTVGPVYLLADLRTWGWLFNPIGVYYCFAADGSQLDAVVLEVTNTPWGERTWYVLDARGRTEARRPKAMHVSPFLPMDLDYAVTWSEPDATLALSIVVERCGEPVFAADLELRRAVLDPRRVVQYLVAYPLLPLRVSASIYVEALRVRARRVPFHAHPRRSPNRAERGAA